MDRFRYSYRYRYIDIKIVIDIDRYIDIIYTPTKNCIAIV